MYWKIKEIRKIVKSPTEPSVNNAIWVGASDPDYPFVWSVLQWYTTWYRWWGMLASYGLLRCRWQFSLLYVWTIKNKIKL